MRKQTCPWHNQYPSTHVVYKRYAATGQEVEVMAGDLCADQLTPCVHKPKEIARRFPEIRTIFEMHRVIRS